MKETTQTPIDEKYLTSGDLFALKYSNGFLFFRVNMWEQLQYKPYSVGDISPQSNTGFNRLENTDGDDILHVQEGRKRVLHASIGMSPSQTRRYTNYPESENRLRKFPNLSTPSATKSSDYGYIDGNISPFEQPTDAGELYIPPDVHLDFDFENPDENESISPKLNIRIRDYHVSVIDPSNNQDVIRRVMSPGSPIPVAPVGSPSNQTRASADVWDQEPVTQNEISRIMRN